MWALLGYFSVAAPTDTASRSRNGMRGSLKKRAALFPSNGHSSNILLSSPPHVNIDDTEVTQSHQNAYLLAWPSPLTTCNMAGNDDEKDGFASQPGNKRKIGRKQLNVPKPIVIPDSCKVAPDGSLDSPWMRLGHDVGLNLTAPRTPEQERGQRALRTTVQLEETAFTAESKQAPAKKKDPTSKQERAAPSPSTKFTTKNSRKSWTTPLSRTRSSAPDGDISYWSSKSRPLHLSPSWSTE